MVPLETPYKQLGQTRLMPKPVKHVLVLGGISALALLFCSRSQRPSRVDGSVALLPEAMAFGMGYDAILGDPWARLDAGWRKPVLSVEGSRATFPEEYCAMDLQAVSFGTAYEAQTVWSRGFSFGDGVPLESRFVASSSLLALAGSGHVYAMAIASCATSRHTLLAAPNVTEEFRQRVRSLPSELRGAEELYSSLVTEFGTHYADSVTMGAKAARLTRFNSGRLNAKLREGFCVDAAARADFLWSFKLPGWLEGGGANLSSVSSLTQDICIGACPEHSSWHEAARRHPAPIGAVFRPLQELLTAEVFPDDDAVAMKRQALVALLEQRYSVSRGPAPAAYGLAAAALNVSWAGAAEADGITYVLGQGIRWTLGGWGTDCNTVCMASGARCEEGHWVRSKAAFTHIASVAGVPCGSVSVDEDQSYDPMLTHHGLCFWSEMDGACDAYADYARRLCPCQGILFASFHNNNSWSYVPATPALRFQAAMVGDGHKVYVLGGQSVRQEPLATVEVYSPSGAAWYERAPMSMARAQLCAAMAGRSLYAIGGAAPTGGGAERYDVETDRWEPLPDLLLPRSLCAAALAGSCVYVAGGLVGDGTPTTSVERWCPGDSSWANFPPMQVARGGAGLAAVGNSLFAIGGLGPRGYGLTSVERVELSRKPLWHFQTDLELAMARFGMGVSTRRNSSGPAVVLVVGGQAMLDEPSLDDSEMLIIDQ